MDYRITFRYLLLLTLLLAACEDSHYIEKDKEVRIISKQFNNDSENSETPILRKVVAVSKDKAWSCDSTGLMLLTTNEGNDWQNIDINTNINDLLFVDEETGWVITDDKILFTNDACKSFNTQKVLTESFYRDLYFNNISKFESTIAVALNTKYLAVSKNSGNAWYFSHIGNYTEFSHSIVTDLSTAYYFSKDSIFYNKLIGEKVISGSMHFKLQQSIIDVKNHSNVAIWIATEKEVFLTDTDFNIFTIIYTAKNDEKIAAIDLFDDTKGVILTNNASESTIRITKDNGLNWESLYSLSGELLDIDFIDEYTGFAVGKGLAITITH